MSKWEYIKENYIDKGLKIFPVVPNGKTPMIDNWQTECSCDYMQVLYWYTNCPNCNWGLPCTPNNIFAIDLDVHNKDKNGIDSFNKIINDIRDFPITIDFYDIYSNTKIQETPSGGIHIIFQSDDELKNVSNGSNVFKDYPGIDTRSDGYILVEPSIINDKPYHFIIDYDIAPMSDELKQFIIKNANLKTDKKKEPYEKPKHVDVGDRDNQLFDYINSLYFKTRLDYEEILLLANHFNETVFDKPLSEKSVTYKVKKAFDKDRSSCIFVKIHEE